MALLTRLREPRPIQSLMRGFDPERVMREMLAWDPFAEMAPFGRLPALETPFFPDIDCKETKDGFEFAADVPGVKEEDIDISVTGRQLTLSGKREEEREEREGERYYACERAVGTFTRSFTLPQSADLDKIEAELTDGVLHVKVAKTAAVQPKKIPLQAGAPAKPAAKAA